MDKAKGLVFSPAFFGLLMVEVVRRYVFNSPTAWGNELIQYIFGTYIIVSAGAVVGEVPRPALIFKCGTRKPFRRILSNKDCPGKRGLTAQEKHLNYPRKSNTITPS